MRESAKGASEASRLLNVPGLPSSPRPPAPAPPPKPTGPPLVRARAASGALSVDALLELADGHGLAARRDAIAALARHSVRLTPPTLAHDPPGRGCTSRPRGCSTTSRGPCGTASG
jgi:hypothetical protein